MKIATVGKGGSGKTTVAGTLARILARGGGKVLAIDGDPNPNLALTLGITREGLQIVLRVLVVFYLSQEPVKDWFAARP